MNVFEASGKNLSAFTSLRLGGPAKELFLPNSEEELMKRVSRADEKGERVLLIGGGSNLFVADEGFDGVACILKNLPSSWVEHHEGQNVRVCVDASYEWDCFVFEMCELGYVGLEAMSGIPGLLGASPIQNIGAYGQEVKDTIQRVYVYDRAKKECLWLSHEECRFSYRNSLFKEEKNKFIVLKIEFQLTKEDSGVRVLYKELASYLYENCVQKKSKFHAQEVPNNPENALYKVSEVRDAVLFLRKKKSMVLDASDPDSRSAGSFFTNPKLSQTELDALRESLGDSVPYFPYGSGLFKVPAAFLIEKAGFTKGYSKGNVCISPKHALALVAREEATSAELRALAKEIRDGVFKAFHILLEPEPEWVSCKAHEGMI